MKRFPKKKRRFYKRRMERKTNKKNMRNLWRKFRKRICPMKKRRMMRKKTINKKGKRDPLKKKRFP